MPKYRIYGWTQGTTEYDEATIEAETKEEAVESYWEMVWSEEIGSYTDVGCSDYDIEEVGE